MFNQIGGQNAIGAPLPDNQIGGESFIRHIGNDKLIFNFKSGSGTTVKDRSREGNDGTFGAGAAAPTWKRNSLYFDGGDNVVLTGINHGITTGSLTMGFNFSNIDDNKYIFSQTANLVIIDIYVDILRIYIGGYINITNSGISTANPIHIQVTRENSGVMECYLNGNAENLGNSRTGDISYDGVSTLHLNSAINGSGAITGTIYSFRILNKGLSGIEAQQIYLSQKFSNN